MERKKIVVMGHTIVFEIGDMVAFFNSNVYGPIESFTEHGSICVNDCYRMPQFVRFMNNTPENNVANALLEVLRYQSSLQDITINARGYLTSLANHNQRKTRLEKQGFCADAIKAQLKCDFPSLYEEK